jgi:hypothetical protein
MSPSSFFRKKRLSFKQCLGETGKLISSTSQAFLENHVYVDDGACTTMCVQEMCGIVSESRPSEKELLEVGQWARKEPGKYTERISEFVESKGLKQVAEYKGRWFFDELYAGNFTQQSGSYYYLIGLYNNERSAGHALLVYKNVPKDSKSGSQETWRLYDPNFGTAEFPASGACLLAVKRVMQNCYPKFGPYFPFVIWRYSPW